MRYESCDLRVCEFALKPRHLVLALLDDGDQVGVRLLQYIWRVEWPRLHGLTGGCVAAAIGGMAHLALRLIYLSARILSGARRGHCEKQQAGDSKIDKVLLHGHDSLSGVWRDNFSWIKTVRKHNEWRE